MPRKASRKSESDTSKHVNPPARTPEERERQMINLAIDEAERQLMEGTAPASVIVHYLKLASSREQLERERLQLENKYTQAKTEAIAAEEARERKYEAAIKALGIYSGRFDD